MSEPIIDRIDWIPYMRDAALAEPDLFDNRLPERWIQRKCRQAALIALAECPAARTRLLRRRLSEEDFASVVCEMVLRVARQYRFKMESSGNYQYERRDDQPTPPGYDPSPRLFVSKAERSLLNGYGEGHSSAGIIHMGFDPGYGGA